MPKSEPLLGYLTGESEGPAVKVAVYKAGRTYRLSYAGERHLCHPSVRSIAAAMRETFLVFQVKVDRFEPL